MVLDGAAEEHAQFQAATIAAELEEQGGPPMDETMNKQVIAVIAYLQRLGTDLYKEAPADAQANAGGDQ
jgi:cbb3-type cytochrome oxidase cytochrome c subunit